jgi:hypothetical protein
VHVMPRYVLHNLLDVPLQCKQAGTAVERELTPGVRSSLLGLTPLHDSSGNCIACLQARSHHPLHVKKLNTWCRFLPLCTGRT